MSHNQNESTPDFAHLLLTRFNLDYSLTDGNPYICDEEWHQERFKLFFTFCLPSVKNQTCKDFTWLIFFNKNLKDVYQNHIEQIKNEVPQSVIVFVAPEDNHLEILKDYIRAELTTDRVVTSRFDNDDVLSCRYIELLQNFIQKKNNIKQRYLINAGTGYQAEVNWPYRIGLVKNRSYSSFITLVDSVQENSIPETVLDKQHQNWKNGIESLELTEDPVWIQIIHDYNLANNITTTRLFIRIKPHLFKCYQHPISKYKMKLLYPIQFFISLKNKVW